MTDGNSKKLASRIALFIGLILMALKFWAYDLTGSQSILSDALESIVNVTTAAFAIFVISYGSKPKDQNHPYGHGKIELFSSAFEGALILFAAMFIMVEAISAALAGDKIHHLDSGLLIIAAAGVANLGLGLYLIHVAKKTKSVALRASGLHVMSDFWTSLGIVVGLVLVQFSQLMWIDSLLALLVGMSLGWSGFKLLRESFAGLMDEEALEPLKVLRDIFTKHSHSGIIQIHWVKMIRSGNWHHIDAHIVVPEFWTIDEAHEKCNEFEKSVILDYPYEGEINFHMDPCHRAYCSNCSLENCPIRKSPFTKKIPIEIESMRSAAPVFGEDI